ncbi:MAG TPA: hypothetical protein VGI03_02775 [Verrucomicrobiae bacterium]
MFLSENGFQSAKRAENAKPHGGFAKGAAQSASGRENPTPRFSRWWRKMAHHKFEPSRPRDCPLVTVVGFSLHQFSDVLKIRDAAGHPYILIGGQAVNYWAERYLSSEPELKSLQPFTNQTSGSGRKSRARSAG